MNTSKGRYMQQMPWTPLASGTVVSASGNSDVFESAEYSNVRLTVTASACGGTSPTLAFNVKTDVSATGAFTRSLGTFTTVAGVTSERKCFSGADRFVRLDWTLGGSNTPTITAGVDGEVC